jgi:hypothetical protein
LNTSETVLIDRSTFEAFLFDLDGVITRRRAGSASRPPRWCARPARSA